MRPRVGCRDPSCSMKTSLVGPTFSPMPHYYPELPYVVIAGINDALGTLHVLASHSGTANTKASTAHNQRDCLKEDFSSDVGEHIAGIALHGEIAALGVADRILESLSRACDCNGGSV